LRLSFCRGFSPRGSAQCPTPFPYTTLFRSVPRVGHGLPGVLEDETDRIRMRRRRFITAAGVAAATGATAGCGNLYSSDPDVLTLDRKSTRLNSSHVSISYAVFCLKKKTTNT